MMVEKLVMKKKVFSKLRFRREDSMCEICSRILKSAGALARHKREVHECEEFVCQECGLVLETATKLKSL